MQQAPATPKLRRWRNLILARFVGLKAEKDLAFQISEQLALALRAHKCTHRSPASQVVFLLPLVRREHVQDWSIVETCLRRTLTSFLRQSDPNWIAVICGQDRPELPKDDRIRFLPFDDPFTGNDKWAKLSKLVTYFPKVARPAGYVMTFDSDDLAHRDLVKTYLSFQHPNGYIIDHSIVHDIGAGLYGQAGSPNLLHPLRKPFWKLCGSCAAFRYDPNEPQIFRHFLMETTQHEHRMFPYLAKLSGRPLLPLRNNLIIYEVNHGENFDPRLGQGDYKVRFVKRNLIKKPELLKDIENNFGKHPEHSHF